MSTVSRPVDPESDPRVKAVFDDIRATRQTDFINNMWRYLAFDPALLEQTWSEVKRVMATPSSLDPLTKEMVYWRDVKRIMATPSALDPLTKEMLYIAVSVANGCGYCVHSHTAAARARGMSPDQHAELLSIVGLAARTNHLATALQVPVDPAFDQG